MSTFDHRPHHHGFGGSAAHANPAAPGPGKRTLVETVADAPLQRAGGGGASASAPAPEALAGEPGGSRDWRDLVTMLGVPEPPQAAAPGAKPSLAAPGSQHADRCEPVQRKDSPDRGPSDTYGACLGPEAVMADLQRIANAARLEFDVGNLRDFATQVETLRLVIDACGVPDIRGTLLAQLQRTQDALVAQFQVIAVQHADQTLQAWDAANGDKRQQQRSQYQNEAWTTDTEKFPGNPKNVVTEDWCGMFADAQFRAAGFAPAFNRAFDHTDDLPVFFTYRTGQPRSPDTIKVKGADPALPLFKYHSDRGSLRTWLAGAAIGDDIRPGDVITLKLGQKAADSPPSGADGADHICIVASYTPPSGGQPGRLVTIDGNAYGARKPGSEPLFDGADTSMTTLGNKTTNDVSTSSYARTGDASHPDFDRSAMIPSHVDAFRTITVVGRGRPSVVDFEFGHAYFVGEPAPSQSPVVGDPDGPGGPIQRKDQGASTITADPAAAFDADSQGPSGAISYLTDMQRLFGRDFSSVRSCSGRDPTESSGPGADAAVAIAHRGVSGPGQALPHGETIQRLFGRHDVSDINAHVGGIAAEAASSMGAVAYATGDRVAFQQVPDLHTAAHEATHVMQQRAGVRFKGIGQVGDRYEQHADAVADAVVMGRSAEPILDQMAGDGSGGAASGETVQCAIGDPPPLVDEYGEKTRHINDCGPADLLMILRMLPGDPESLLKAWITQHRPKAPFLEGYRKHYGYGNADDAIGPQEELDVVRLCSTSRLDTLTAPKFQLSTLDDRTIDVALKITELQTGLVNVLSIVGANVPTDVEIKKLLGLAAENELKGVNSNDSSQVIGYLQQHCSGDKAVIILGVPGVWTWGGDHPTRGGSAVTKGPHFVIVYSSDSDKKTFKILDPSNPTHDGKPIDVKFDDVAKFIQQYGSTPNLLPIPLSDIRKWMPTPPPPTATPTPSVPTTAPD